MDKDNSSVHDCLIFLLVAIIAVVAVMVLGGGGFTLNKFTKIILTVCISFFLIVLILISIFLFNSLWGADNKAEFFLLNETNINNRELINSQKRIAVDKNLKRIPARYFSGNKNLEIIEFFIDKNSSLCIEASAFFSCSKLTTVKIHGGTTVIGENAFSNCKKLKTVVLETDLYELKQNTFASCEKLSKVEFPKSLNTICCNAFCGCKELKEITIPKNVTKIENKAFLNCSQLEKVNFEDSTSKWVKDNSGEDKFMFNLNGSGNAKILRENKDFDYFSIRLSFCIPTTPNLEYSNITI